MKENKKLLSSEMKFYQLYTSTATVESLGKQALFWRKKIKDIRGSEVIRLNYW